MVHNNKKCEYCGAVLPESSQLYKRKYCSDSCGNKFKLRIKKPDVQAKLWQHEPKVFEDAMAMHRDGVSSTGIARHFGIPVGTMYSWVHDFGDECKRAKLRIYLEEELSHAWSLKECFRLAQNAKEWLAILQNAAQNKGTLKDEVVRLVCEKLYGQSASKLASVIFEKLKADPLSGETFAFCNKCGNVITTISWNEPIYHVARYVKTRGTFIWPNEKLGQSIKVTRTEFEHLIDLKKSMRGSSEIAEIP